MTVLRCLLVQRPPKVSIGPPHPDPVVETSSLSAVQPPEPTYDPKIKDDLENSKALSCLQIETLVYASQVSYMVMFCFAFLVYDVSFCDRDTSNTSQMELGQGFLLEMELV